MVPTALPVNGEVILQPWVAEVCHFLKVYQTNQYMFQMPFCLNRYLSWELQICPPTWWTRASLARSLRCAVYFCYLYLHLTVFLKLGKRCFATYSLPLYWFWGNWYYYEATIWAMMLCRLSIFLCQTSQLGHASLSFGWKACIIMLQRRSLFSWQKWQRDFPDLTSSLSLAEAEI